MNSLFSWFSQLRFDSIFSTVIVVAASLLCITFHETSHGLVAYLLGDQTAKRMGRLTLNPIKHVDLLGLVMMAIAHFGWAKPVPVDMRNFKKPKTGMALTALAGPVSNVLLAYLAMVLEGMLYAVSIVYGYAWLTPVMQFLACVQMISTGLAVFNIFPIPPLDGSKVVFCFLPDDLYVTLMKIERYGMLLLAALLMTNVLDSPLTYLRSGLSDFLFSISKWSFYLVYNLIS